MSFSRRQFLKTAAGATILTGAGCWAAVRLPGMLDDGSQAPTEVPTLFPAPQVIRYDSRCFTIHDRDEFLFSACFHYARCPEPLWRDRLEKLRTAGFNAIESYVFWNYHEPVEGQADLGEFERFVTLIGEMGFRMIARPGPYVCAEWDAGGFPHWVIAKQFPLRSDDPESIRTSRHWFDLVLPVIARHQITRGGPIVLMQLENEYDYWKLKEESKAAYVTALAEMAWSAGIEVPLLTCWTRQVREHPNAALGHVFDCCNFYPRWNILKEVPPALAQLRQAQPNAPQSITELQGGWFSEVGGKLSEDQEGIGPPQINMLTKTVIEQGVTFFSYYMGFGGTNFDWAAKGLTTTYDYDAPLHEPGGMGDKFYVARGIGESLRLLGGTLTRAEEAEAQPEPTNLAVTASLRLNRTNGKASGALFLRENENADQTYRLRLPDPADPARRLIVPQRGTLMIGAREMKMCPVGLALDGGGELRYSTAEVLAQGEAGRAWVILYEQPGRPVEFALAAERFPRIAGDAIYREWEPASRAMVIGMRTDEDPRMVLVDERLQVILVQRDDALRSWAGKYPRTAIPGAEGKTAEASIPFLTDAALLRETGQSARGIWADMEFLPGEHTVKSLLPRAPARCTVNGQATEVSYDSMWQTARVGLTAPALPVQPVEIPSVETWVERFDPALGDWLLSPLKPLEDLGQIPYGYVKYRHQFNAGGGGTIVITTFADDGKKVFLDGKPVAAASTPETHMVLPLNAGAKAGLHTLEIVYELFGSPNFGPKIAELKGIQSATLIGDNGEVPLDGPWHIQRAPAPMRGREVDPDFHTEAWTKARVFERRTAAGPVPAFTWCRAEFPLAETPKGWQIPWRVEFRADCDALLYVNGKFVGRYATVGPQAHFFLPEPYLRFGGEPNVLTVVLAYVEGTGPIQKLQIAPYWEFATYRARVGFEW
ncbi:MAG: beta-galactosidase [Acidobacteriota bacterium]|nr:beta-galactosidase [Acidobacteriota bacterium]